MRHLSVKPNRLNLKVNDIGLILGIGTLAVILNVYPYPIIVAGAVVIGILLSRVDQKPNEQEINKRASQMSQEAIEQIFHPDGELAHSIENRITQSVIHHRKNNQPKKRGIRMKHVTTLDLGGIKCDTKDCTYRDDSVKVEDYADWINKPCPICNANLLTKKDYDGVQLLIDISKQINSEKFPFEHGDKEGIVTVEIEFDGNDLDDTEFTIKGQTGS